MIIQSKKSETCFVASSSSSAGACFLGNNKFNIRICHVGIPVSDMAKTLLKCMFLEVTVFSCPLICRHKDFYLHFMEKLTHQLTPPPKCWCRGSCGRQRCKDTAAQVLGGRATGHPSDTLLSNVLCSAQCVLYCTVHCTQCVLYCALQCTVLHSTVY